MAALRATDLGALTATKAFRSGPLGPTCKVKCGTASNAPRGDKTRNELDLL